MCKVCGLPKDLCVCDALEKEQTQRIEIYLTTKRYRKKVTIVEGIDEDNVSKVAKDLKHKLACGGSAKDGKVVLQGVHVKKVKEELIRMGFPADNIRISHRTK